MKNRERERDMEEVKKKKCYGFSHREWERNEESRERERERERVKEEHREEQREKNTKKKEKVWLVGLHGMSTLWSYLMPNPIYTYSSKH